MNLRGIVTEPFARAGAVAQNALEIARFGGLDTGEEPSPFEIVEHRRMYRLRRYFGGSDPAHPPPTGPPVVLVPPMMLDADVYDVSPAATAVGVLHELGIDAWVVDFGEPTQQEGGLERTLTDHVLAVSEIVDIVREKTGRDVHLGGYSQGGMFCYQAAAYRRGKGLSSLITFGSPADTRAAMPFGLPEAFATGAAGVLAETLGRFAVPAWVSRNGFRMLDPVKSIRSRVEFIMQLHDREALLPRERQRQFLEANGWVAWPGPALADFLRQFIAHNRMLEGGFVIEDRLVTLADIDCPILTFVGEVDEIAPPPAVRAISRAAPRADIYETALRAGHFGLVVGSTAKRATWPVVAQWAHWRDGDAERPEAAARVADSDVPARAGGSTGGGGLGVELAYEASVGIVRAATHSANSTVRGVRELTREAASALPRLTRLGQIQGHSRISLASLLDEQARRHGDGVFFLFEDRAHTHQSGKERIDNVVAGLLHLGVRQGEHVGVLMATRPSALVVVAAINRLGAVGVLLRPDGDVAREGSLGRVTRVVSDPEHAQDAQLAGVDVLVLGGGGDARDLGSGVIDMERIDPDAVEPPDWYRPNPGRARDLAFILFTGGGESTRVNSITNGRWALSAFGTASAGSLSPADTVYAVTPIHHSSALLMTLGGAIAGGSRIALAHGYDPATFWEEVRRYGVTVASYTWTMLRELVDEAPTRAERHHPVRLLLGSGMPVGLWERVQSRFAPARVVEFYASTEGEAILVNLTGAKPGAVGRPLPGGAEVRIAAWDENENRLLLGADGFAREVPRGEIGMLLSRTRPENRGARDDVLRSVFRRDDAWVATGDLFRQDSDGDYWLVDRVEALVNTAAGLVATSPARDALARISTVDLAAVYGLPVHGRSDQVLVAAVMPQPGCTVTPASVSRALADVAADARPSIVHLVDELPVTSWYRPDVRALRDQGIPPPGGDRVVLSRGKKSDAYRPLTQAAYRRLAA
ncbi:MAG: AMP-binding protein [Solirubrobacteraceae bacterium]